MSEEDSDAGNAVPEDWDLLDRLSQSVSDFEREVAVVRASRRLEATLTRRWPGPHLGLASALGRARAEQLLSVATIDHIESIIKVRHQVVHTPYSPTIAEAQRLVRRFRRATAMILRRCDFCTNDFVTACGAIGAVVRFCDDCLRGQILHKARVCSACSRVYCNHERCTVSHPETKECSCCGRVVCCQCPSYKEFRHWLDVPGDEFEDAVVRHKCATCHAQAETPQVGDRAQQRVNYIDQDDLDA